MNTGMLWFDNDPKIDLGMKIAKASAYFQNKYGYTPNLCFVHPSMVKDQESKVGDIAIKISRSVQPNHFWLGLSNAATQI